MFIICNYKIYYDTSHVSSNAIWLLYFFHILNNINVNYFLGEYILKILKYFLILIPLSIFFYILEYNKAICFFLSALSIIPLAGYLGQSTEEIAAVSGPKLGGFLNATFGNATEIIISIFAIKNGMPNVVKESLAGSILGNILLVLGCSIFIGGLKHKELKFDAKLGSFTSTMLVFASIALAVPAVFILTAKSSSVPQNNISFSVAVSIILLIIYIVGMIYSFKTQKDLYGVEHADMIERKRPPFASICILLISTIFIAVESEMLVNTLSSFVETCKIPENFVGLILIPIVGNAAEHTTAVTMALKNKMDISIEISVGSSLQIALFALPLLVIVSLFFTPINIIFSLLELFIICASVIIANQIVSSGSTNWIEGLKLLSIYTITAIGFLLIV